MVDHVQGVHLGQALDLVVEREEFTRFGLVHFDRLALACDLCVVDFAFALGGQIGAGTHAEGRSNHAGEPGEEHIFAVAGGSAGDAGDNAEDGAETVVDAVNRIADPRAGLLTALVPLGEQLLKDCFGVDFWRGSGKGVVTAEKRSQFAVVILLIFDHVFEDGDGFLVTEGFELFTVAGDGAALFDFEAAEGHADAAGAAGQRVRVAAGLAGVSRRRAPELLDAAGPQGGMFQLRLCQMPQYLSAHGVGIAIGQRRICVITLHLGLPVPCQGSQHLLGLCVV